jgi:hypothetical protein
MAQSKKEKVEYTDSTAKRDLEARLNDDSPAPVFNPSVNPDHEDAKLVIEGEGDGSYVAVSPEYANAANEIDQPLQAEEGADKQAEEAWEDSYGDSDGEVSEDLQKAHEKVTTTVAGGEQSSTPTETPATTEGSDEKDEKDTTGSNSPTS